VFTLSGSAMILFGVALVVGARRRS
jgi:hypothetical protein